ncbi:hypothetical protein O7C57_04475 [Providencia sp. 21OH12SH02B-Prov]|uniref:hypothetical protein n=1 Tax=Providencia sp. 21OH12SH02B-Prov TaxID=3015951 RepID=UPI0022B64D4E|nr:hypothetical protein [Providencia sp. 21OH12SH02B-Prov]WBA57845.1 hypothetical protein O7C57_04475 [Providencia sp. 21OH12SH02B-Prov]HEM8344475.1 hypothetical protein [Providencia stuartii]
MEFKGTPGPWVIDEWSMTGIDSESKHVALVNYSHRGLPSDVYGDEHEANANLIAAAPELLESLRELVSAMERYEIDVDESAPVEHKKMMKKAKAAIVKALGQQ